MTKEEFQSSHLTVLAARCGEIARTPSVDAETREKAKKLELEWRCLQKPRSSNFAEKKKLDVQHEELKKRMVDFLSYV